MTKRVLTLILAVTSLLCARAFPETGEARHDTPQHSIGERDALARGPDRNARDKLEALFRDEDRLIHGIIAKYALSDVESHMLNASDTWIAVQETDTRTMRSHCTVGHRFAYEPTGATNIHFAVDAKSLTTDGTLADYHHGITHPGNEFLKAARFLVDGKAVDLERRDTFFAQLKEGRHLEFAWRGPDDKVQVQALSLEGFAEAWDTAVTACANE